MPQDGNVSFAMLKLDFSPGVNREGTSYSNEQGWYNGNLIRFRYGRPESIGGWRKVPTTGQIFGIVRFLHDFTTLSSQNLLFLGSEEAIYLEYNNVYHDITPIDRTISIQSLSKNEYPGPVTVTCTAAHNAATGDVFEITGMVQDLGGIPASQIEGRQVITEVVNATTFEYSPVNGSNFNIPTTDVANPIDIEAYGTALWILGDNRITAFNFNTEVNSQLSFELSSDNDNPVRFAVNQEGFWVYDSNRTIYFYTLEGEHQSSRNFSVPYTGITGMSADSNSIYFVGTITAGFSFSFRRTSLTGQRTGTNTASARNVTSRGFTADSRGFFIGDTTGNQVVSYDFSPSSSPQWSAQNALDFDLNFQDASAEIVGLTLNDQGFWILTDQNTVIFRNLGGVTDAATYTPIVAERPSVQFYIDAGISSTVLGAGWSSGAWSRLTWGSNIIEEAPRPLRLWFADDFGEDLICNIRDGAIYYWDASNGLDSRAVALTSLPDVNSVPTVVRKILVSEVDRHVIAFGVNPIDSTELDPLLIRWSSQESVLDWEPRSENTAGDLRLSQGSEIITAVRTTRQILVFTDSTLHSLQFTGAPFVFGTALLGDNVRIVGPNAAISINDVVYWMGQDNFYIYDGRILPIACSVRDYVFSNINRQQSFKFHAGSLASQTEVWWFYCSEDSEEINRYVVYNYGEKVWYYGNMSRTAWNDRTSGIRAFPQAVSVDSLLYNHEDGWDDGSTTPATQLNSYIESSDFDLGEGYQFMFIRRLLPDVTFTGSEADNPSVNFVIKSRDFTGDNYEVDAEGEARLITTVPIEQYTDQIFTRARGRQIALRIENSALGTKWRLGSTRLEIRSDGRR